MCQAMGNASCTASLTEKCTGGCNAHTAIFCNGNFINADDANCCADDLKNILHIEVSGYAYASSGCDGGTCEVSAGAGGSASASCDMSPSAPPLSGGILGLGVVGLGVGVVRRRRKASK
jgi:MYXO-CTERM domain-containing protein